MAERTSKDTAFLGVANIIYEKYMSENGTLEATVIQLLKEGNGKIIAMKRSLYKSLYFQDIFFEQYFDRRMTSGNEQCPYWEYYDMAPKTAKG